MNIGNITSDNFNLDGNGKDIQIEVYEQLIEQLQQENKKLNGAIQTYDILLKANTEENKRLKDNWNKLKECLKDVMNSSNGDDKDFVETILNIIQELEQGSDK